MMLRVLVTKLQLGGLGCNLGYLQIVGVDAPVVDAGAVSNTYGIPVVLPIGNDKWKCMVLWFLWAEE